LICVNSIICLTFPFPSIANQGHNHKSSNEEHLDNLIAPIYIGDVNVTEGRPFTISCIAQRPIDWHKDGGSLQFHLVRHSKERFQYAQKDTPRDGHDNLMESVLSVTQAIKRHEGKYKCNPNHTNFHMLNVHDKAPFVITDEDEYDHEEARARFEPPIGNEKMISTVMVSIDSVTETVRDFDDSVEQQLVEEAPKETSVNDYDSTLEDDVVVTVTDSIIPDIFFKSPANIPLNVHSTHPPPPRTIATTTLTSHMMMMVSSTTDYPHSVLITEGSKGSEKIKKTVFFSVP